MRFDLGSAMVVVFQYFWLAGALGVIEKFTSIWRKEKVVIGV